MRVRACWQPHLATRSPSSSPTTISTCTIWDLHCSIIIVRRATHNYICGLSGFYRSCQVVYSSKVVLCTISRVLIGTFTDFHTVVDVLYSLRFMAEPRWISNRLFSFHSLEFEEIYRLASILRHSSYMSEALFLVWIRSELSSVCRRLHK